jgi:hypothetical protein
MNDIKDRKKDENRNFQIGDYNGDVGNAETLYIGQMTVREGKRTGTYKAFAEPFVGRGLTVLTYSHVTKV